MARIVEEAARRGTQSLRGPRAARLDPTVTRFHAFTFEAERRLSNAGVHNIDDVAQVTDLGSGQILAGPSRIVAAFPALSGRAMAAARAQGQSQRSMIEAHLSQTIAAGFGAGPDNRASFIRSGG